MNRLKNKVAIVTGAARGIGLSISKKFCEEGASVLLTDIDDVEGVKQLHQLKELGFDVDFLKHNVTNPDDWDTVISYTEKKWGQIDILVNNAGIAIIGDIETISYEDWKKTLNINLDGVFLGTKSAISKMKASKNSGSIINIASIEGLIGEQLVPAYNASKGGVRIFTKSAANHCSRKGYNIRINNICPGFVETQMVSGEIGKLTQEEATMFVNRLMQRIPMTRFAKSEEIANAVLFLASDESSYMTGSDLVIDGGYTAA